MMLALLPLLGVFAMKLRARNHPIWTMHLDQNPPVCRVLTAWLWPVLITWYQSDVHISARGVVL